jgi:hypothetical protein
MFLVVLAAIVLSLNAQDSSAPPAEPWKWTLEQRLQARFDPAARAARVADAVAREARIQRRVPRAMSAGEQQPGDVIDGNQHPELFLPTELFERFVRLAYVMDSPTWRLSMRQRSDDILRTDADWEALDVHVAEYAANLKSDAALFDEEDRATRPRRAELERQLATIRASRCALEKHAMRRARAYFGAERFDRFLYLFASRGISSTYVATNPFSETQARLKATEESCR